jgi:hypothetical protein
MSKFQPHYVKWFLGLDVIVVRDKEKVGPSNAELIADSLDGIAKTLWIVEARTGKDTSDSLAVHPVEEAFVLV